MAGVATGLSRLFKAGGLEVKCFVNGLKQLALQFVLAAAEKLQKPLFSSSARPWILYQWKVSRSDV